MSLSLETGTKGLVRCPRTVGHDVHRIDRPFDCPHLDDATGALAILVEDVSAPEVPS